MLLLSLSGVIYEDGGGQVSLNYIMVQGQQMHPEHGQGVENEVQTQEEATETASQAGSERILKTF